MAPSLFSCILFFYFLSFLSIITLFLYILLLGLSVYLFYSPQISNRGVSIPSGGAVKSEQLHLPERECEGTTELRGERRGGKKKIEWRRGDEGKVEDRIEW